MADDKLDGYDTGPVADTRSELDKALDEGVRRDLPPNVPPGFLGEVAPDMRRVDEDGPRGLNAGIIDEWTWETTLLTVILLLVVFFPGAYWVLWRSHKVPKAQKWGMTALMTAAVAAVAWRLLAG